MGPAYSPRAADAHGRTPGLLGISLIGIACGVGTVLLLRAAGALGIYVPTRDVQMDYAKGVLWAVALLVSVPFWPVPREDRTRLTVLWGAKIIVTLGLMLLYERNYQILDAYGYFAEGVQSASVPAALELGSGTVLMMAIVRLHAHWLVASYHAIKVSFAMIGFVATYLFYRAARVAFTQAPEGLLWLLMLFPSVLFWSSILGKDPIALLGLSLYSLGAVSWIRGRGGRWLIVSAAGVLIAMAVRLWLGPICVLPLLLVGTHAARSWWKRLLLVASGGAALFALVLALRNYFAVQSLSDTLQFIGRVSTAWSADAGVGAPAIPDLSNPAILLGFLPRGAFTALFRPLPGEIMNPFGLLAGVEDTAALLLLLRAIARSRWRDLRDPVVTWAVAYLAIWAIIYAPVSYQNLGTAVRFRLQVWPAMLLLLLYLGRPRSGTREAPRSPAEPERVAPAG